MMLLAVFLFGVSVGIVITIIYQNWMRLINLRQKQKEEEMLRKFKDDITVMLDERMQAIRKQINERKQ